MKVIKVGTSAQSRIAQACDRCRSKKIRCDGITPCCTQCSNVGFECKTSDKLSRRAFPRGYTESLEERVRALESEVKELKDLLDEKDEKIDILSRIHPSSRKTSTAATPPAVTDSQIVAVAQEPQVDTFRVQQSPCLLEAGNTDSYFMGTSSGRSFVGKVLFSFMSCGKNDAHRGKIPSRQRYKKVVNHVRISRPKAFLQRGRRRTLCSRLLSDEARPLKHPLDLYLIS